VRPGWYFNDASSSAGAKDSPAPTYPTQATPSPSDKLESSSTGSFCPATSHRYLHRSCSFAGSSVETVPRSFYLSCGSELTRQGISLP
jgi:hypothetical protein